MNGPLPPATLVVHKPDGARLGLDQQPLFALGMAQARAYASARWTDHNIHDPGVTALEVLSYALTDVCARSAFPVEDLLAVATNNDRNMNDQFFTVAQALPGAPVTVRDYRKLLIDIYGVRNAWLLPENGVVYYADPGEGTLHRARQAGFVEVRLRGLYRVLIDRDDAATLTEAAMLVEVRKRLDANRSLCEDFIEVEYVPRQPFLLCAEIELAPEADTARAQAAIWFAVERYLAPPVRRYSRADMLARRQADGTRRTDPEIFDGPLLEYGFIEDAELDCAELRTEIRLSDLISEIMDVPGVRAVRDMVIRPADEDEAAASVAAPDGKWRVAVNPGQRATLARASSRLVFYKGGMPVQPVGGAAELFYQEIDDGERAAFGPRLEPDELPAIPLGRARNVASYRSVQEHFPAIYGIGEEGPPAGAAGPRLAQVKQLQAYLLFFDQILANAVAQLANLRQLFSRSPAVAESYFWQAVKPQEALYSGQVDLESPVQMLERRARFLDHLIARTGERLTDHLSIAASAFGTAPEAGVRARCAFLEECPTLAARRGLGYDHTQSADDANAAGLERRLVHLLGIGRFVQDVYAELDGAGVDRFRFRLFGREDDSMLLRGTARYATAEEALAALERAVEFARIPPGYERMQADDDRYFFHIIDEMGTALARSADYFATESERDAAITRLMALLHEHFSERLLVIENILLRPEAADEPFLPICADPGCTDCAGFDPYSYRVHIVLPADAGRFKNMDFRRFAEETIRRETPAHVLPKICWLGEERMAEVEKAWRAWQALLDGSQSGSRPARLAALSDALFESKSTYPEQHLHGCDAPESQQKFILDRSPLGSLRADDNT